MQKSVGAGGDLGPNLASRRRFMAGAGLATLGGLFGGPAFGVVNQLAGGTDLGEKQLTANDINVLNFALNIEYLGAEFYLRAVTGQGLPSSDVIGQGNLGGVQGGSAVQFRTPTGRQIAEEIAFNESSHVRFLRTVLGPSAVARPPIDLEQGFTMAAQMAGLIGPGETFNPFADEVSFWVGAFMFEDVDVTAYKGSARLLTDPFILEAAAGILAVEGYHAGSIRTMLYQMGEFRRTRAISILRDQADGPGDRDQPIRLRGGDANIVPTDNNGIAYSRTPEQVLNIVYLGGAPANFGFFPERVNGAIR